MPIHESSIASKAFGNHADPSLVVAYQSHQDAMPLVVAVMDTRYGAELHFCHCCMLPNCRPMETYQLSTTGDAKK